MDVDSSTVAGLLYERARAAGRLGELGCERVRVVLGGAVAVAYEAADSPTARTVENLVSTGSPGRATVIGHSPAVSVETAVLANAALIHALLLDDAHAGTMTHPAAVVIPVALALAEELDAPGTAIAAAIAAGYETLVGFAAPVAHATAAKGFRNTLMFGAAGAAAAAATLLGLDRERFMAAVLIASDSAGGTLQAFRAGSPEWRFQPGITAQAGLSAARLAAALDPALLPFPPASIEAPNGVYETLAGRLVDWRDPMGEQRTALQDTSHKVHATCGANQVVVGALDKILRDGVEVADITRIDVGVSQSSYVYPGCEDYGPFSEQTTYLSRPLAVVATALAGGGPLRAHQIQAALSDPRLDDLLARVHSHIIPAHQLRGPQDATVEVTLRDGSVRRAGIDEVDPRDLDPDWDAIQRRLRAAAPRSAPQVIAAIEQLPVTSARQLTAPLRAHTESIPGERLAR